MSPDTKFFENIFLQSFNAIAVTNTDFSDLKFEFVNPAFLNLTGYKEDEILGKSPKILQGEKTFYNSTKRLKEACLKGEVFKGENINYRKDGKTYWVEWIVSPIKDEEGNITNYLSIQKDITNEKKLEEKLIENVKINTLHSISAGLTHELNSALTTIKGSTEMLQLEIDMLQDDEASSRFYMEVNALNKSIEDIANITNSLHHLTNSDVKLQYQVNIFDLIMEALKMYEEKINRYTVCTINGHLAFDKKDVHFKEFYANIQKESIKHVFMIIIDNAVDHLVKKDNKNESNLNIEIKQNSQYTVIDFIDNAGGLKHKNIAKLFNPLDNKREDGGLGIGLHVAKNIMLDQKGDIQAFSTPPQTTLRVTIPL